MTSDPNGQLVTGVMRNDWYKIGESVGRGSFGVIHAARNVRTGEAVAVKMLNNHLLANPCVMERYHREARAASSIGHPNICAVLDAGMFRGRPFLVMDLLTGATLAERILDFGALPFRMVVDVLSQILSGLAAAHAEMIVHRDIKPDNVFLSEQRDGSTVVKLLDFGLAKSIGEAAELSLTHVGMVVGTPYYMAPEQACKEKLDHRADLYSCGVVLYEILTGRRPFTASNHQDLMIQVMTADRPDPRRLRPAVPEEFVGIVRKAMARDREKRFANAAEFIHAIQAIDLGDSEQRDAHRSAECFQSEGESSGPMSQRRVTWSDIPVHCDSDILSSMDQPQHATWIQKDCAAPAPRVRPAQLAPAERLSVFEKLVRSTSLEDPAETNPKQVRDPSKESDDNTEVIVGRPWIVGVSGNDTVTQLPASVRVVPSVTRMDPVPAWDDEERTRRELQTIPSDQFTLPDTAPKHPRGDPKRPGKHKR